MVEVLVLSVVEASRPRAPNQPLPPPLVGAHRNAPKPLHEIQQAVLLFGLPAADRTNKSLTGMTTCQENFYHRKGMNIG